jgi:hypothetical protein
LIFDEMVNGLISYILGEVEIRYDTRVMIGDQAVL